MGRDAYLVQPREYEFRDAVVEDALALDDGVFGGVEGGGVVLEMLDERARFRAFVKDFGLAFINASAPAHVVESIRLTPGASSLEGDMRGRSPGPGCPA